MRKFAFFAVLVLLAWKLCLFLVFPFPNADGPWALSHTYSIMRGEFFRSEFAHGYMDTFNLPYLNGLLQVPFFYGTVFKEYHIFVVHLLFLVILLEQLRRYFMRRLGEQGAWASLVFSIAILTSTYTYSLRPELPIMILMMLFLSIVESGRFSSRAAYQIGAGAITAVVGLIHPVAGFYTVMLFIGCAAAQRFHRKAFLLYALAAGVVIVVLYGPVIAMDPEAWYTNFFRKGYEEDYRGLRLITFAKYLFYSPGVTILIATLLFHCAKRKQLMAEVLLLMLYVATLFLFSRSYYYPYMIIYLASRVTFRGVDFNLAAGVRGGSAAVVVIVCALPLFSHYWPTIQLIENPKEVRQWSYILEATERTLENARGHVWVSPHMGMAALPYKHARMHFGYYDKLAGYAPPLRDGDIILVQNKDQMEYIHRMFPSARFLEDQMIAPASPGLMRFSFPVQRAEPIYLWKLTFHADRAVQ